MIEQKILYRLIYESLLQVRAEANEIKNKKIYWITNLIHNLPLQLENAKTEQDYEQILEAIGEC